MHTLSRRRGAVSIIELVVVIVNLLVIAYFTVPHFVGEDSIRKRSEATADLTIAYNAAKAAWGNNGQRYDQDVIVEAMRRSLPNHDIIQTPTLASASAPINGDTTKRVYVAVDNADQITLCVRARTLDVMCLRANEAGALAGPGDLTDGGYRARSWGRTDTDALCFLPTAGSVPVGCNAERGGEGWVGAAGHPAMLDTGDAAATPTVSIHTPENSPDSSVTVHWTTGGEVSAMFCGVDAAGLEPCDRATSHTFTNLAAGEHTLRVRAMGRGGVADAAATWTRITASTSRYRDAVLADGPAAYWRLGEADGRHAYSEVGSLTLSHTGRAIVGRPGLLYGDTDTAYGFRDGGLLSAGKIPTGFSGRTNQVTLEAWVRFEQTRNRGAFMRIGQHDYTTGTTQIYNGYAFGVGGASDKFDGLGMRLWGLFPGVCWINSGYDLPAPGTYHVAMVIGANNRLDFYVNGTLVGNQRTCEDGTVRATNAPQAMTTIGGAPELNDAYMRTFTGDIDEVAVYAKALTVSWRGARVRCAAAPGACVSSRSGPGRPGW